MDKLCNFIILLIFLLPEISFATPPSVSTEDMVHRSAIIAVAKVIKSDKIQHSTKDKDGNWLMPRYRIDALVSKVLKNTTDHKSFNDIVFEVEGLTLENGRSYIVFLQAPIGDSKTYQFIDMPTKRIEVSSKSDKEINNVIKLTKKFCLIALNDFDYNRYKPADWEKCDTKQVKVRGTISPDVMQHPSGLHSALQDLTGKTKSYENYVDVGQMQIVVTYKHKISCDSQIDIEGTLDLVSLGGKPGTKSSYKNYWLKASKVRCS